MDILKYGGDLSGSPGSVAMLQPEGLAYVRGTLSPPFEWIFRNALASDHEDRVICSDSNTKYASTPTKPPRPAH